METKTVFNSALVTATALNITCLFAEAPSTDPRYEQLKAIMREYVQQVVVDECSGHPEFNYDAYRWNDYEIRGLEVVLFDILNHTANYCKPPELTGMHSSDALVPSKAK
jgi:hypothetical protein